MLLRSNLIQDGFYDKTNLMRQSPYDRTLFIDADTYVVDPVSELFSVLDQFDCAATHEEYLSTDWFSRYSRQDIPESFPEFNTGILMLKRSDKMERFLQSWVSFTTLICRKNRINRLTINLFSGLLFITAMFASQP